MKDTLGLVEFAARLEKLAVTGIAPMLLALDAAAAIIEHEAKAEIGHYQRKNTGRFEPWAELADSTKAERVRLGFSENEPLLRTGDLRDSISREVHGLEAVVGSTSMIMVYQELGTDTIPPRAVLGLAAMRKSKQVAALIGAGVMTGFVAMMSGGVPRPFTSADVERLPE